MTRPNPEDWLDKDRLMLLQGWAREGLTDEQIAKNMGINVRTLYRWKKLPDKNGYKFSQISQALKNGKEVVDFIVENALLKAAMNGSVTAQIFWLKNRKPAKWRDSVVYKPADDNVDLKNVLVTIQNVAESEPVQESEVSGSQTDQEAS